MKFQNKTWIALVAVVLIIVAAIGYIGRDGAVPSLSAQIQNDLWYFTGSPVSIQASGDIYASAGFTEGGVTAVNANPITGALATTTLTLAALQNSSIIFTAASSTIQNMVVPGTSTLSVIQGFLPNIGDFSHTVIDLASTTAGGVALTAGSGVTLKYATTTSGTIAAGNIIDLTLFRDTASTLLGLVTVYK